MTSTVFGFCRFVFRLVITLLMAVLTATLFPKPRMHYDTVQGGTLVIGALFFCVMRFLFDGEDSCMI